MVTTRLWCCLYLEASRRLSERFLSCVCRLLWFSQKNAPTGPQTLAMPRLINTSENLRGLSCQQFQNKNGGLQSQNLWLGSPFLFVKPLRG